MHSYRAQLAVALIMASVLPLLLIGGIAARAGEDVLGDAIAARERDLAYAAAGFVEAELGVVDRFVVAHARRDTVGQAFETLDPALMESTIRDFHLALPDCANILYVGSEGVVVAAYPIGDAVGANLSSHPLFDGPTGAGRGHLARMSPHPRLPYDSDFGVGAAVRGEGGVLLGVVSCPVDATSFRTSFYSRFSSDGDRDLFITDALGRVVVSFDPAIARAHDYRGDHAAVAAGIRGERGAGMLHGSRETNLSAWAPVADTGWVVVSSIPAKVALAPIVTFQHVLWGVGLALLAAGIGGAYHLGGVFSRPVERISHATEAIAAHDYDVRVPEDGPEEVARLARSLNAMAEKLGQQNATLVGYAEALEVKVRTRTEELREQNLVLERANQRLAEADRFKSAFLANMSHELRTPLNAIIGYTELTLENAFGPVTDKQKKRLGTVLESARHLLELINDILDLSKVASGRMELRLEDVDVEALLEEAHEIVAPLAARKGVTVEFAGSAVASLHTDRTRLKQCLLNYLSNAVKFTPDGGVVTVRVVREGDEAIFRVRDTGPGIPPEDQEKLFKEFSQLDNSLTRKHGGTGLGLALTKTLTELAGGRVGVESELGRGSVFFLTIPIHVVREVASRETASPNAGAPVVLVVDDEPETRESVAAALREGGFDVVDASTGEEAIQVLQSRSVDVVVLDIILPGPLDGWEVFRRIRSGNPTRAMPVVFMSQANGSDLALALGATAFYVKPVVPLEMVAAVRAAVEAPERRVLVADDDPVVRQALSQLLTEEGFRVECVEGGEAAIAAASREIPAAIVVDLVMPDVDGFQVIERVRSDDRLMAVPLLVLTAKDLTDEERRELVENADAIYPKGDHAPESLVRELKRLGVRTGGDAT